MTIEWNPILEFYNQSRKTNHSMGEFLEEVYRQEGSLKRTGDFLGVSDNAIRRKMDIEGVDRNRQFFRKHSMARKLAELSDEKLRTMTAKEISEYLGCTLATTYLYLNRQRRDLDYNRQLAKIGKRRKVRDV